MTTSPQENARWMPEKELDELFDGFRHSLFRLETLDHYLVETDKDRLDAFLRGEPKPQVHRPWLDYVRQLRSQGKRLDRVHVVTLPLSDYLNYEISWGYVDNSVAGERVGIALTDDPAAMFSGLPFEDFWLFDDEIVARVAYDPDGRYLGARKIDSPPEVERYVEAKRLALTHADPLDVFLRRQQSRR